MAEILLSLTIIGVVAAITLPSLTGNINERTWNTQRKALYARMSQAISLMPALNGYGTLDDTTDTAAETFVTAGLSKVLKINNICDSEHLTDCGITNKITALGGGVLDDIHNTLLHLEELNPDIATSSTVNTKAAAFETANGESIMVYYNPKCVSDMQLAIQNFDQGTFNGYDYVQEKMCANFIFDMNGNKGPNTVGKDIGVMTVFFPTDSVVVSPKVVSNRDLQSHGGTTYSNLNRLCSDAYGKEYRALGRWELGSAWINKKLFGLTTEYGTAISTTRYLAADNNVHVWRIQWNRGFFWPSSESDTGIASVFCEAR